jgi:hypothetical protein
MVSNYETLPALNNSRARFLFVLGRALLMICQIFALAY